VSAYTDGSCQKNGDLNAISGSGVWYGDRDHWNISCRLPDCFNTNNAGEIVAVLLLAQ